MRKVLAVLVSLISTALWSQNLHLQKETLLETDRKLAKLSTEKGTVNALLQFMQDDAIVLPKFGHPIHGRESFRKIILQNQENNNYDIPVWKPVFADISKSGDFGYTFGRYALPEPDTIKYEDIKYNYYGSVWKRQQNGSWKLAIHTGLLNLEGIEILTEKESDNIEFEKEKEAIKEVDRAFSQLSDDKGNLEAFYGFIADDGIAISGNGRPPANKERYRKLIEYYKENKPSSAFELLWEPLFADIAASGELGYTHGHARWSSTDSNGKTESGYGYYLSIWKKQADGSWQFVFDGGNQSPSRKIANK